MIVRGFLITLMITLISLGHSIEKKAESDGFAIVELFTSEGCSSCPPADLLLGEIAHQNSKPIYALAFHVDYWDYIGWKDPYAEKAYSNRQREYAQAFQSTRIYTPQMIVNGQTEFVGSNRGKANSAIESALRKSAKVVVTISDLIKSGSKLDFEYSVSETPKNTVLNFALVEGNLVHEIGRGENSGRTLRHENVVRAFKRIELKDKTGRVSLEIPDEVNSENSSIIAYVQDTSTMEILGATGLDI